MPGQHTEKAFETAIENHLLTASGYSKVDPATFDRERAIDPTILIPSSGNPAHGMGVPQEPPEREDRANTP